MHANRLLLALVSVLALTPGLRAADAPAAAPAAAVSGDHPVIRLWEGDAPGAQGSADVDVPMITVYRAPSDKASGAALVVCPGGGYGHLAVEKEGVAAANFLNSVGVSAFILQYRL